jgi:cyclomaltodextrinase
VERAAIYHQPASHYAFSYDGSDLYLRIRAKKGDIKQVTLIYADPYEYDDGKWVSEKLSMKKIARTEEHDYFGCIIKPERRRVQYGFILEDFEGETVFYGGRGFFANTLVNLNTMDYYFKFPFIHKIDTFQAPDWVKHTIWYQIFPERFANGDPSLSPQDVLPWGSKDPSTTDFFGGDLVGITEHLDYLEDLGINGIYLTPIFEAPTNHKYDTLDYMKIDPHFGDKKIFRQLVDEAHKRGIKVMLDAVFNHIGDTSEIWQDVVKHEEKSKYKDWFHIHSFPVRYGENGNVENATSISYDTFAFTTHMPKLNTSNKEVQQYLLDIAAYWIREFDIDGWRLDVANEVDHAFWKKFRQAVRKEKADVYILGEIWHDSWIWLLGDEFDAVMNYPFTQTIIENYIENKISPLKMVETINEQYMRYPKQVSEVMFNMLDSHDTARILTRADGNKQKVKLALGFMFAHTGSPCIYYGTEIGLDGANDPLCRKCMVWEESKQDLDMLAFTKQLISIRKKYQDILSLGDITWDVSRAEEGLISFTRELNGESLTFIFNQASEEKKVPTTATHDVFENRDISGEISVPKEGFKIVR